MRRLLLMVEGKYFLRSRGTLLISPYLVNLTTSRPLEQLISSSTKGFRFRIRGVKPDAGACVVSGMHQTKVI